MRSAPRCLLHCLPQFTCRRALSRVGVPIADGSGCRVPCATEPAGGRRQATQGLCPAVCILHGEIQHCVAVSAGSLWNSLAARRRTDSFLCSQQTTNRTPSHWSLIAVVLSVQVRPAVELAGGGRREVGWHAVPGHRRHDRHRLHRPARRHRCCALANLCALDHWTATQVLASGQVSPYLGIVSMIGTAFSNVHVATGATTVVHSETSNAPKTSQ